MIYGGKPLTPVAPSKQCNTEKMVIRGPGAYSYGMVSIYLYIITYFFNTKTRH